MLSGDKTILAISGSLRKEALNTVLLHAAKKLIPADWALDVYEGLGDIPPYNDDVRVVGFHDPVEDLRERVRAAGAITIIQSTTAST